MSVRKDLNAAQTSVILAALRLQEARLIAEMHPKHEPALTMLFGREEEMDYAIGAYLKIRNREPAAGGGDG